MHTPPPWQVMVSTLDGVPGYFIVADGGNVIATVKGPLSPERYANARILAAGAEMYEALREYVRRYPANAAYDAARIALSKADPATGA